MGKFGLLLLSSGPEGQKDENNPRRASGFFSSPGVAGTCGTGAQGPITPDSTGLRSSPRHDYSSHTPEGFHPGDANKDVSSARHRVIPLPIELGSSTLPSQGLPQTRSGRGASPGGTECAELGEECRAGKGSNGSKVRWLRKQLKVLARV